MAFTFGFYNAFEHDRRYDAIQVSKIFDGIIADGVYATVGKAFVLKINEVTGDVNVQPGRAWFDHTWSLNDADLPMIAPGSDLVNDRWDAVVLDINRNQEPDNPDGRLNQILWIQGTPSLNPEKPTLIKEDEHTQYPLGYIYRKANSLEIVQADIENTVGTSECPFVTGIIETIHIDDLLLQWRDEWLQYTKKYEQDAKEWIEGRKKEYLEYFADLKREGDKTLTELIRELLDFRNANEAYFLNWIDQMKDVLSQYPGGEIYLMLDELKAQQNEILDMIINGYKPIRLITNDGICITNDIGTPLLVDIPLCPC